MEKRDILVLEHKHTTRSAIINGASFNLNGLKQFSKSNVMALHTKKVDHSINFKDVDLQLF